VPLDESGAIGAPAPCVRCGYDLRGLTPQHQCPECGAEVLQSLSGDMLRFADRGWLSGFSAGLKWLIVGDALNFAACWLILFGLLTTGASFLMTCVVIALTIVGTIGVLKATAPELGTRPEADSRARRIARACAAPYCLLALFRQLFRWAPGFDLPIAATEPGLGLLLSVLATVLTVAFLLYLAGILGRTRHAKVRFLAWIVAGGLVLEGLYACGARFAPRAYSTQWYRSTNLWHDLFAIVYFAGWWVTFLSAGLLLLFVILARRAVRAEQRIAAAWRPSAEEPPRAQPHEGV